MRLGAGVRPPIGEAMGAYGSSRFSAVGLWLWSALLISNGVATQWQEPRVWMRAADLVLLAAVILLAIGRTFTPAVIISADAIRGGTERRSCGPRWWTFCPRVGLGKGCAFASTIALSSSYLRWTRVVVTPSGRRPDSGRRRHRRRDARAQVCELDPCSPSPTPDPLAST